MYQIGRPMARQTSVVRPGTKDYPLKNVYFVVRCTRKDHTDCGPMRDAVFNAYPGIMSVRNCLVDPDLNPFCVTGRALVMEENLDDFEEAIKKVRTRGPKPAGVAKLEVMISE